MEKIIKMDIIKELTNIDWKKLRTLSGKQAESIPNLLLGLLSNKEEEAKKSFEKLYDNVANQGTIYEASYYIIPFLNRIIEIGANKSKEYAYDLLFEIVNGYPLYDDNILYKNEELNLKVANYKLVFESIDFYIDNLEFTTEEKTSNYILDLLSLFYKDDERKLVINKLNKIENSLFQTRMDEVIQELSISQKETEEYNEKVLKEYKEENKETLLSLSNREYPKIGVTKKDKLRIFNNIQKMLDYEIKIDEGIGNIYFGMQERDFITQYVSYELVDNGIIEIEYLLNDSLRCYKFFNSVEVCIEVTSGIRSIFLKNNFKGKYKNTIGINNTYSEIKNRLIKMNEYGGYYEDYLLVGKKKNFFIAFDFKSVDPDETEILEDWIDWKNDKGEEIIKDCNVDYILLNS